MSTDYTPDMLDAQADIREAGRAITIIQLGSSADPLSNDAQPLATVDTHGVMVAPSASFGYLSAATNYTSLFANCTNVAIVAGDGVNDFTEFHTVVDRGVTYKIDRADKLDVGNVAILYYLGLVK